MTKSLVCVHDSAKEGKVRCSSSSSTTGPPPAAARSAPRPARRRQEFGDWVVVAHEEDGEILRLRPLDGTDREDCGVMPGLGHDRIMQAQFPDPPADRVGDRRSPRLRRITSERAFRVRPRTPPDLLALVVLLPTGDRA